MTNPFLPRLLFCMLCVMSCISDAGRHIGPYVDTARIVQISVETVRVAGAFIDTVRMAGASVDTARLAGGRFRKQALRCSGHKDIIHPRNLACVLVVGDRDRGRHRSRSDINFTSRSWGRFFFHIGARSVDLRKCLVYAMDSHAVAYCTAYKPLFSCLLCDLKIFHLRPFWASHRLDCVSGSFTPCMFVFDRLEPGLRLIAQHVL